VVDDVDRYFAIAADEIQVTMAFATDGMLMEYDLVVLKDDKNFFHPYEGAIIIRYETANKHPELAELFGRLVGILTDDVMRDLNYRVDVDGESPRAAAESFLRMNDLIR
jgi:osmoprotectant transport system permease protein